MYTPTQEAVEHELDNQEELDFSCQHEWRRAEVIDHANDTIINVMHCTKCGIDDEF